MWRRLHTAFHRHQGRVDSAGRADIESEQPHSAPRKPRIGLLGWSIFGRRLSPLCVVTLLLVVLLMVGRQLATRMALLPAESSGDVRSPTLTAEAMYRLRPAGRGSAIIPQIVHQSWRTAHVPDNLKKYVATWRQSGWDYVLHSDLDNARLVAKRYPWLAGFFRGLTAIQRADVSRLLYMHAWGGVCARAPLEHRSALRPPPPHTHRLPAHLSRHRLHSATSHRRPQAQTSQPRPPNPDLPTQTS